MVELKTPCTNEDIEKLKCGDVVKMSGVLYTGRDQAHKRMVAALKEGGELPFDIEGQAIYYVGPTPNKPGEVIKIMIGKGKRNDTVIEGMKKYKAVYLAAIGGAGAYISNSIKKCEIIAYDDLGAEAVRKLEVEDLQLIVAIDCEGNNIYDKREEYAKTTKATNE